MRKYLLGAALALLSLPAFAADMPVKATAIPTLVSYTGSQFYGLVGTALETDKATVSGLNGTAFTGYAAGGQIIAGFGYIRAFDAHTWGAWELWGRFQNIGSTSGMNPQAPGSISIHSAGFTERFMLGGDWLQGFITQIATQIPNLNIPVLPTLPVGAAASHPYAFIAAHEDQVGAQYLLQDSKVWRVTAGAGLGVQFQWNPSTPGAVPVTADLFTEYKFAGKSLDIGNTAGQSIASASMSGGVIAGLILKH